MAVSGVSMCEFIDPSGQRISKRIISDIGHLARGVSVQRSSGGNGRSTGKVQGGPPPAYLPTPAWRCLPCSSLTGGGVVEPDE